ncbi:MAG: hypothetical protein WAZ98_10085 [Cyclobacteriaceae bacterium]
MTVIKNSVLRITPIVVIVLAAMALFWLKKQNNSLSTTNQRLATASTALENGYLNTIEMQWILEGASVSTDTQLIDSKNNAISIKSLAALSNKPTYLLNFNWDACQDCITQEISLIQSTIADAYTIAIIISFDSLNEYFAYVQMNKSPLPIYYLSNSMRYNDALSYDFGVYGFILTRDGKVLLPHVANSSLPELSKRYYELLSQKTSNL